MIRTVGSEFQTDGAENLKAHLQKSVLVNGWTTQARFHVKTRFNQPQKTRLITPKAHNSLQYLT